MRCGRRAGRVLELDLDQDETGQDRYSGRGDRPPLATQAAAASLRLTCRVAPTDVWPAGRLAFPGDGERASSASLLHCRFVPEEVPDAFGLLAEASPELVLGRNEGVVLHFNRAFGSEQTLLRLP